MAYAQHFYDPTHGRSHSQSSDGLASHHGLPGYDLEPAFSPDGQRLYFSSQRGPAGVADLPVGVTYEITGPFDQLLGRNPVAAG